MSLPRPSPSKGSMSGRSGRSGGGRWYTGEAVASAAAALALLTASLLLLDARRVVGGWHPAATVRMEVTTTAVESAEAQGGGGGGSGDASSAGSVPSPPPPPRPNYVLSAVRGMDPQRVAIFVQSWRRHSPDSRLVVFQARDTNHQVC